ncbi:MAG: DUF1847 domain-containing protein [Eggerthellaceae bacterium]|nr:DUF1847 domain-containing protein [Eggerthellaceae bacterium]
MTDVSRSCIDCATGGCKQPEQMYQPDFCPSAMLSPGERDELAAAYADLDLQLIQAANEVSARCGCEGLCRLEEIMDFARRLGYRKIGIANCGAMQAEALTTAKILRLHGYEVFGVSCKYGSVTHEQLGIPEGGLAKPEATTCNPLAQAERLNAAGTELNVVMGLCVGHDSIFVKHSDAPCTTFVVKDRMLGNNPVAVLHTCNVTAHRWSRLKKEDESLSCPK